MTTIISDKSKEYHGFVGRTLEKAEPENVKSVVMIIMTKEGTVIDGYWNANVYDRMIAKGAIDLDIIGLRAREIYADGEVEE